MEIGVGGTRSGEAWGEIIQEVTTRIWEHWGIG